MDQGLQQTLLRRLVGLRDARTTSMADDVRHQPVEVYTDPGHLQREFQALFRGHPLVVGLSRDLDGAGTYRAIDVAGVPVLLVRGEDTVVRAFLNSCRHRGSPVASGAGSAARVFKCPYHAWCYDINGRLLGQPIAQDAFAGVPNEQFGLIPLPVAEISGLLLLAPSGDAPPVAGERYLAGLAGELGGLDLAGFSLFAEQEHELATKWKQPYETFLEAYHVFELHRTTLARQILSTPMLAEFFGPHGRGVLMTQHSRRLSVEEAAGAALREIGNLVYWLFPNVVLSLPTTGHAELWLFYPDPQQPGQCRARLQFYVPPDGSGEANTAFWQRMLEYSTSIVLTEDFTQQEAIYRGLASGSHPGLVFGRNEPALIHYHRGLDDAVAVAHPVVAP